MEPKTIIDKIWDSHVVVQNEGHPAVFFIDLMLIHEVTSAQAFQMLRDKGLELFDADRLLATVDHSIPTRPNRHEIFDDAARTQVETLRKNVEEFGVPFFDFESGHQGIVHVVGPELGATQPGMTIVCGDSHTATHGAFGALAFGVGTSEVGHVLASGCLLQKKPKTMAVRFEGTFREAVSPKDAIIKLISQIGTGGGNGHVVEYCGSAIRQMSMEERMTVCNMSIECGARAGLIAPDETTFAYLKDRPFAPRGEKWEQAMEHWSGLSSDDNAPYAKDVLVDIDALEPMVTWGTNPAQAIGISERIPKLAVLDAEQRQPAKDALEYVKLEEGQPIAGVPIDWAFVGSCTNGRIEDLRVAAKMLAGRKVSPSVTMYVVPGSEAVREQAISEGLDKVFIEAGADFRMPGCSMCLGMNDDKVPAGKRCISTSNRNFVGRQGTGSITHLASPATVCASAIEGLISSPALYMEQR